MPLGYVTNEHYQLLEIGQYAVTGKRGKWFSIIIIIIIIIATNYCTTNVTATTTNTITHHPISQPNNQPKKSSTPPLCCLLSPLPWDLCTYVSRSVCTSCLQCRVYESPSSLIRATSLMPCKRHEFKTHWLL